MCSPSRTERAAWLLLAALAAGCSHEKREYEGTGQPPRVEMPLRVSELQPGAPTAEPHDPHAHRFDHDAWHIGQGQLLFERYNCTGCHAHGGGSIGPALMDEQWRYGGHIEQVHASIAEGRPNGMPAFRGKIPDDQIWQLAAYVRALSGNVPKDVKPGGNQGMSATPSLSQGPELDPKTAESGQ